MVIQGQLCSDNFGFSLGGSHNFLESGYGFNDSLTLEINAGGVILILVIDFKG